MVFLISKKIDYIIIYNDTIELLIENYPHEGDCVNMFKNILIREQKLY